MRCSAGRGSSTVAFLRGGGPALLLSYQLDIAKYFFCRCDLPYFFSCKREVFSFQNNPKDLDPSCKMDLDPCDCLGRVKLVLYNSQIS